MQCSCGGETTERTIQRDKKIVMVYQICKSCGRLVSTSDTRTDEQKEKMGEMYGKEAL
jgi:hypothetical protein